jgi:hypothetical protein
VIHVTSAASLIASETENLTDVTNKVEILYGGNQHYDARSGSLSVDVVLENKSSESIHAPVKLAVRSLSVDYRYADVANANNREIGGGAVWDLSDSIPEQGLETRASSRPFTLRFRCIPNRRKDAPFIDEDFLDLNIKVFAARQNAPEGH